MSNHTRTLTPAEVSDAAHVAQLATLALQEPGLDHATIVWHQAHLTWALARQARAASTATD